MTREAVVWSPPDGRDSRVALLVVFDELCIYKSKTSGATMWPLHLANPIPPRARCTQTTVS